MRATRPLEVTVAVYPTLVLTNALPYDMDIVVWQVRADIFGCIAFGPPCKHQEASDGARPKVWWS